MPVPVLMPALSPTMEKGNLAKWIKGEGDKVKVGDVIAEIETDKASMEIEAADEGTLGRILVPEGTEDVAVNTPIAVILSEGESVQTIKKVPAAASKATGSSSPGEVEELGPSVPLPSAHVSSRQLAVRLAFGVLAIFPFLAIALMLTK